MTELVTMKEAASLLGDRFVRRAVAEGWIIPIRLRPYTFLRGDIELLLEQRKELNRPRLVKASQQRVRLVFVKKVAKGLAD